MKGLNPNNDNPENFHPDSLERIYWDQYQRVRALQGISGDRPFTDVEIKELIDYTQFRSFFVVQVRALTALRFAKEERWKEQVTAAMVKCLLHDPNVVVREYAAGGLVQLDAYETIPLLQSALASAVDDGERDTLSEAVARLERRREEKGG